MRKWPVGMICACLALGGCHADARYQAARDVRAFLTAARAKKTTEFDSYIDRAAVRADIIRQIQEGTTLLRPEQVDYALGALLQPATFSIAIEGAPASEELPTRATFALALQWLRKGQVCLPAAPDKQRCAITFAREGGRWKLVGVRAATFFAHGLALVKPVGHSSG